MKRAVAFEELEPELVLFICGEKFLSNNKQTKYKTNFLDKGRDWSFYICTCMHVPCRTKQHYMYNMLPFSTVTIIRTCHAQRS